MTNIIQGSETSNRISQHDRIEVVVIRSADTIEIYLR